MKYFEKNVLFADRTVAIDSTGCLMTYGDMYEWADEIRDVVPKRSLVFSFCHNVVGSVAGYFGFLCNEIVPVLLDRHIEKELALNLIEVYHPDFLYVPMEQREDFGKFETVLESYEYCLLKTNFGVKHEMYPELGLLLTTSGSTGSPKFVRQSYANIQANAESIVEYLQLDETERPITTLPMNYTYGLSIVNSHLLVGATILLTDHTLMEKGFWEFFKENRATSFGGVPYTYEMLKKLRFFRMDLPSLRYMTQAGGKLSPELHKEFAEYAMEHGKKMIVMYGQTEATARMAYLPAERSLEKYGSMGIAIPGGKFTLVDVNEQPITEPEITGELIYEGPNVTLGYAQCAEDLAKGDERGGRLVTGDMAKMDADGFFYIVGRKKRFLKIYGNRVNLDEVERMLKSKFDTYDFAVAGRDDNLYVFVTVESEEIHTEIRHFLAEKTGLNPKAFTVKMIAEVPKNEAGKTLYSKLEELY